MNVLVVVPTYNERDNLPVLARGVPVGSDIEFSDQATLARALEGRKDL